jgi:hypothetical protein
MNNCSNNSVNLWRDLIFIIVINLGLASSSATLSIVTMSVRPKGEIFIVDQRI